MVCDLGQAQQRETSVAAIRHRGLCHYWYSELLQAYSRRTSCLRARPNPAVFLLWRGMEALQSFLHNALSSRSFLLLDKLVAALSVVESSCRLYSCYILLCIFIKQKSFNCISHYWSPNSISEDGWHFWEAGGGHESGVFTLSDPIASHGTSMYS